VRSSMRWVIGLRGQGMEGKGCFVLRFGGKAEARPERIKGEGGKEPRKLANASHRVVGVTSNRMFGL
jgi:hypothetical protein